MSSRILEIKGANDQDLELRSAAFDKLNALPTVVLKNLAEVSESKKAQSYFSNSVLFNMVKGFISK